MDGLDDCEEWTKTLDKEGYGVFNKNGKQYRAHRYAWIEAYGETSLAICHKCNNKACIKLSHLYEATPELNITHAALDGLFNSTYTPEIIEIVRTSKLTPKELEQLYGISSSYVSQIRSGKRNPLYACKSDKRGWTK